MLKSAMSVAAVMTLLGLALAQGSEQNGVGVRAIRGVLGLNGAAPPRITTSPPNVAPIADVGPGSTIIEGNRLGQFETTIEIKGRRFPALIDTGATYVALTYEDATSSGIALADADFKFAMHTANGTSRVAAVTLPSIRVGNVEVHGVQAVVAQPGALTGHDLLGMSFLGKLKGFETGSNRLILKQ